MTLAERVRAFARVYAKNKRGEAWRAQEPGFWRASTMGLCGRQQAYNILGVEPLSSKEESTEKSWSLEDGHLHEGDMIARICSLESVNKVSDNQNVKRVFKTKSGVTLKIAGTPDLVIEDCGEEIVVELKALQDYMFNETKRQNEPPEKYRIQTVVYLLLLKLKRGVLFIKNRNNSDVISFTIEPTKEEIAAILKRQVKLQKYIDAEKMPPREYELGSQECYYCPHNQRCHEGRTFKGYIHKTGDKKEITVDLDEEPEAQKLFMIAAKTYEKTKRQIESLQGAQEDAKGTLDRLLKKYKADGLSAQGYSVKYVRSESSRPDNTFVKKLIAEGKIPTIKSESSYIRVDLPRVKKGEIGS